jgi:hypothetical protein
LGNKSMGGRGEGRTGHVKAILACLMRSLDPGPYLQEKGAVRTSIISWAQENCIHDDRHLP